MCMPPWGSAASKALPPGSLTHGPSMGGKGSESWQCPKTPKSHYSQAYEGGIILSISLSSGQHWLSLTEKDHKETTVGFFIKGDNGIFGQNIVYVYCICNTSD